LLQAMQGIVMMMMILMCPVDLVNPACELLWRCNCFFIRKM
jgi:hypothetical protein